jgi:hypothetical protein
MEFACVLDRQPLQLSRQGTASVVPQIDEAIVALSAPATGLQPAAGAAQNLSSTAFGMAEAMP